MRTRRLGWLVGVAVLTAGVARGRAGGGPVGNAGVRADPGQNPAPALVPFAVELADGATPSRARFKVTSLVYCGTDGHGGGYAVGIGTPAESSVSPETLSPPDCHEALSAVAKRAVASPGAHDWVEAVRVQAAWT